MRKIRHSFNMVEIVLAIGVVAFGITGVMALLPPALNAMKNVNYDGFMDEASSKVQWLIKYLNVASIPDYATDTPNPDEIFATDKTHELQDTKIYEIKANSLYYVESEDGETGVHVKIWKAPIEDVWQLGETGQEYAKPSGAYRIYICVNWGKSDKWSNRTKRYLVYNIFPNT